MRKDAIKAHLEEVFQELEAMVGPMPNAFIAGGCIASLVLDETPKDYDIWFPMPEDFEAADKMVIGADRTKYATTVTLKSGKVVQLVKNRMGPAEVIVKKFDYLHTQSYFKRDGTLVYDDYFIRSKILRFVPGNFDHPVNTVQRMAKFAKRGYDVPIECVKDIMLETLKVKDLEIIMADKHAGSM